MSDRSRIRVGRRVAYIPTASEAAAGGGSPWPAVITSVVSRAGHVNLAVTKTDGSSAALTDIPLGGGQLPTGVYQPVGTLAL